MGLQLFGHLRRPDQRLNRQRRRNVAGEADAHSRVGEPLDDLEDVHGTRTAQAGHGVQLVFGQLHDEADRLEDAARVGQVPGSRVPPRAEHGRARPNDRRHVRHGPDNRERASDSRLDAGSRKARRDRDQERVPAQSRPDLGEHGLQDLGLHREDDDLRLPRGLLVLLRDRDAQLRGERVPLRALGVRGDQVLLRSPPRGEDAPQERRPHVPRPDHRDFLGDHFSLLSHAAVPIDGSHPIFGAPELPPLAARDLVAANEFLALLERFAAQLARGREVVGIGHPGPCLRADHTRRRRKDGSERLGFSGV